MVLLPLLTLLTGAAIAAVVFHNMSGGQGAKSPAVAAETKDGAGYTLSSARYVGRPVDEVAMQLAALGLAVQRRPDPTALAKAGVVTAIDPVGKRLRPGDVVTLTYSTGANAPRTDQPLPNRAGQRTTVDDAVQESGVPAAGTTGAATTGTATAGGGTTAPTGGGTVVTMTPPTTTPTPTTPSTPDTTTTTPTTPPDTTTTASSDSDSASAKSSSSFSDTSSGASS